MRKFVKKRITYIIYNNSYIFIKFQQFEKKKLLIAVKLNGFKSYQNTVRQTYKSNL